jgi:hypothetical protein
MQHHHVEALGCLRGLVEKSLRRDTIVPGVARQHHARVPVARPRDEGVRLQNATAAIVRRNAQPIDCQTTTAA